MNKLRVAVIGGGAAGLCAARHMAARPDRFEPVVFEKADRVGGTWVYTEDTGTDRHGLPIHSSMYSSLRTNLPKEVMAFQDFDFDSKLPSFIKHSDMLDYLEQYACHFNLMKYIQFHTVVECVKPLEGAGDSPSILWEVKVHDVMNRLSVPVTSVFDAVMVCNGHYAQPKFPVVEGLDTFSGKILHSHNYRHPSIFENLSVLVMGAGASGIDISLDMSPLAKQVYLSHWRPRLKTSLPANIKEMQAVKSVSQREVVFMDDARAEIDAILFCTGYNYDFSFLHPDCKLSVNDGRITPLYKHVLHSSFPSLSLIGVTIRVCPFPHFDAQVQFILAALDGSMKLPSRDGMEADEARDYQKRLEQGFSHRYAHLMGIKQWDYNAELLSMAGVDQHAPVVEMLYEHVATLRRTNVCNYKKMNFRLLGPDTYQQL